MKNPKLARILGVIVLVMFFTATNLIQASAAKPTPTTPAPYPGPQEDQAQPVEADIDVPGYTGNCYVIIWEPTRIVFWWDNFPTGTNVTYQVTYRLENLDTLEFTWETAQSVIVLGPTLVQIAHYKSFAGYHWRLPLGYCEAIAPTWSDIDDLPAIYVRDFTGPNKLYLPLVRK